MTHTKHRKRRERAEREEAEQLPGFQELRRALAPDHPGWGTIGRTGRAG